MILAELINRILRVFCWESLSGCAQLLLQLQPDIEVEIHSIFSCEPCEKTLPEQTMSKICQSVWYFTSKLCI